MKTIKITDDNSIKTSQLYRNLKKTFNVWSYWNEKELDENFPPPPKTTTRYFKKRQESDMWGKSANDVKDIPTMTLREYIIFFEKYYIKTSEYPDKKGWTITSSRLAVGYVAHGDWDPIGGKVRLRCDFGDFRCGDAGPREAFLP